VAAVGTQRSNLLILKDTQQFGLDGEAQITTFVYKYGTAVGLIEHARVIVDGMGEGTGNMRRKGWRTTGRAPTAR
jgi:hypothetical protein